MVTFLLPFFFKRMSSSTTTAAIPWGFSPAPPASSEKTPNDVLPSLPVPSWRKHVLPALQAAVEALGDEIDHRTRADFDALLGAFSSSDDDNGARAYQRALESRRLRTLLQTLPTSWLADWWQSSYLEGRDSLWVNSNVWISLNAFSSPLNAEEHPEAVQLVHAAVLCSELYLFRQHLRTQGIREKTSSGEPLAVDQYKRLFATCRIPGLEKDSLLTFPFEESQHFIVAVAGHYFAVDLSSSVSRILAALRRAFASVRGWTSTPRVGLLTTLDRTSWARARLHLAELSAENREALHMLESAAFVLCLDDASGAPRDLDELAYHGRGTHTSNRWHDKCFQLVVTREGTATVIFDHTWGDGIVMARTFDQISANVNLFFGAFPTGAALLGFLDDQAEGSPLATGCHKLTWTLDRMAAEQIATASDRVTVEIAKLRLDRLRVDIGKQDLKGLRAHPDAFVQLCLQLAFFETRRHFHTPPYIANVYETAATRSYHNGRTETARPRTAEAVQWLHEPTSLQKFRAAHDRHLDMLRRCSKGLGFDRYLFGLARLCSEKQKPLPAFLTHPILARLRQFDLSTSQNTPAYGSGFGFHVPPGSFAGIPYFIGAHYIYFSISSSSSNPQIDYFVLQIEATMREMFELLRKKTPASL